MRHVHTRRIKTPRQQHPAAFPHSRSHSHFVLSYLTIKNVLPYFPFTELFSQKMGTTPLPHPDSFIEVDRHYREELELKHKLLTDDNDYCFAALPGTEHAQWEALTHVLKSLAHNYPETFRIIENDGHMQWHNGLLNQAAGFETGNVATLPGGLKPLDWAGRQVQEDLLILDPNGILVAGQLCFPSGWSLPEKLGKNFMDIHAPLPQTLGPMLKAADMLMARLPVGRPLQRNNWGLRVTNQLDLSSRNSAAYQALLQQKASLLTSQNAGNQIYIRIEHQTLTRLPVSNHILFTIHTYQNLVSDETVTTERAGQLLSFLHSVPPAVADYKLILPLLPALLAYLHEKATVL